MIQAWWLGEEGGHAIADVIFGDYNPAGRLPDDVWDEFPRVCGTFKERAGFHGCQMPEALLMRIIMASSHAGELVLDPFVGSGTTVVAAKRLGRPVKWVSTRSEGFLSDFHGRGINRRVAFIPGIADCDSCRECFGLCTGGWIVAEHGKSSATLND